MTARTTTWAHAEQQARESKRVDAQRRCAKTRRRIESIVCSSTWAEHVYNHGSYPRIAYPVVGMMLCRAEVRWGELGPRGRRWTPRDMADIEDLLDTLRRPDRYVYPSSCGSVVREAELRKGYVMELPED